MSGLRINSNKQNRTVHAATIDEPALLALVVGHVAQRLGLDASAPNLKVRAYVTTYSEGSLGTSKTRIEVELVESHEAAVVSLSAS